MGWYHLLSQVIDIDNIDILFTNISLYHRLYFQGILAFGNYYTLFKLTRDYLILSKIYKAEKLLIERFSSSFQSQISDLKFSLCLPSLFQKFFSVFRASELYALYINFLVSLCCNKILEKKHFRHRRRYLKSNQDSPTVWKGYGAWRNRNMDQVVRKMPVKL